MCMEALEGTSLGDLVPFTKATCGELPAVRLRQCLLLAAHSGSTGRATAWGDLTGLSEARFWNSQNESSLWKRPTDPSNPPNQPTKQPTNQASNQSTDGPTTPPVTTAPSARPVGRCPTWALNYPSEPLPSGCYLPHQGNVSQSTPGLEYPTPQLHLNNGSPNNASPSWLRFQWSKQ